MQKDYQPAKFRYGIYLGMNFACFNIFNIQFQLINVILTDITQNRMFLDDITDIHLHILVLFIKLYFQKEDLLNHLIVFSYNSQFRIIYLM